MSGRLKFFMNRLRERLWFKPLTMSVIAIILALLAKLADFGKAPGFVPKITEQTVETLLEIIAASMLVIATFAVGAMVSSYASAARSATPRSFPLVISDDASQNALSSFIGVFIFSIVALVAVLNGIYGKGGRFALFCLTLLAFAAVVLTFVHWVDRIARLGRLGTTIDKVEEATAGALETRRHAPTLGGVPLRSQPDGGLLVSADRVGYVQRVEVARLHACAEAEDVRILVTALPGTFAMPERPLASVIGASQESDELLKEIRACFEMGDDRTFDEDPRFGLVVLSEIASRALSPAVNDPGTAMDIINTSVRLFVDWLKPVPDAERIAPTFDRVEIPELSVEDMFDDAFMAIGRDGAGMVEVGVRLQKALRALASVGDQDIRAAAERHARIAIARAEKALDLPEDLERVRGAGLLADRSSP